MADNEHDGRQEFGAPTTLPVHRLKQALSSRRSHPHVEIGTKMRAMYDDLLQQPLPDRFVELLKQIDQARESKPQ